MSDLAATALDQLVARILDNHEAGDQALRTGQAHRTRSCAWLTESTLLTVDLLRAGVETDPGLARRLDDALRGAGTVTPVGTCADTRIARLVMGPGVDRRRAYRVVAAARFLLAAGTNDPREALRSGGGVSALATTWGRRAKADEAPEAMELSSGPALPGRLAEVHLRASAELRADLRSGRGRIFAVIEVERDGGVILRAQDADANRLVSTAE